MTKSISKVGLEFIKSFEMYVPYVYDDLVPAVRGKYREWDGSRTRGTLTIGYGHTNSAKHPLKIERGLQIREAEAENILAVDLDECEEAVNTLVKVPIDQGQFDALVSFTFNCGTGNLKRLIVPLNRGDYKGCRAKFDAYTKSKGQYLRGLQRRRDGEQDLWDRGNADLPTEIVEHTEQVDAPPVATAKDLAPISTKVRTIQKSSNLLHTIWMSIVGLFTLENVTTANGAIADVKTFVGGLALPALAVLAICGVLFGRYLLGKIAADYAEGRYTPSGS